MICQMNAFEAVFVANWAGLTSLTYPTTSSLHALKEEHTENNLLSTHAQLSASTS